LSLDFTAARLIADPRADRAQQLPAFAVLFAERRDIETAHARPAHELGHTIDNYDRIVSNFIERRNKRVAFSPSIT
jgi:hypothetical protein